jgi:hypothetical protein
MGKHSIKLRSNQELDRAIERLSKLPDPAIRRKARVDAFAAELRKWWSFDDRQHHTHSWHSREDFIATKLPELLKD